MKVIILYKMGITYLLEADALDAKEDDAMILNLILLPLGFGALAWTGARIAGPRPLQTGLIALGVLIVGASILGLPPFPPISSKHKIVYLLLAIALASPMQARLPAPARGTTAVLILAGAFFWLNWRRIGAGLPLDAILMSLAAGIVVTIAGISAARETDRPFLWPVGLFVATLGLGGVGLLSGYLGLGQMAGGLAAYLGGVLLIPYLAAATGRADIAAVPTAFAWIALVTLGVMGVALASFATNLHPLAFALLLLTLLSPLAAAKLPALRNPALPPITFAAMALPPAGLAIATAYLNF